MPFSLDSGFPSDFPRIGAPATNALVAAGITDVAVLCEWSAPELLALHGFGPRALRLITDYLTPVGAHLRDDAAVLGPQTVDAYLDSLDERSRSALSTLRERLWNVLARGEETMRFKRPGVSLDGKPVVTFGASQRALWINTMSSSVLGGLSDAVTAYDRSETTLWFGSASVPSLELLAEIVAARLAESGEVCNGQRIEYLPDGRIRAEGGMRSGQRHGRWTFYEDAGDVARVEHFDRGALVDAD